MALIQSTMESVTALKRDLRSQFPEMGSSHISEALAAGLGYSKHAALLTQLSSSPAGEASYVLLDAEAFSARLKKLTDVPDQLHLALVRIFETFAAKGVPYLRRTVPASATGIRYTSKRDFAWRNAMVAAINAGVDQGLFTPIANDNRWPGSKDGLSHVFRFIFPGNVPALGSLRDAGFGEVSIKVALWPTEDGVKRISAMEAGFRAGEVYASGWVERTAGVYLQDNRTSLKCRAERLDEVASAIVNPTCFGDRGRTIL